MLAIKRHEAPPPGYFDGFSRQVIARIKADGRRSKAESGSWLAWFRGFRGLLETKPILAGGFGVVACSALLAGVLYADQSDASLASVPALELAQPAQAPDEPLGKLFSPGAVADASQEQFPAHQSLFQEFRDQRGSWVDQATPVSFQPAR